MSLWGFEKIREKTWKQLLLDGLGHMVLGAFAISITLGLFVLFGLPISPLTGLPASFIFGFLREAMQWWLDDSPNWNLVDRFKDIMEAGVGGLLVCLVRWLV